jgi:hypothetical protein
MTPPARAVGGWNANVFDFEEEPASRWARRGEEPSRVLASTTQRVYRRSATSSLTGA